MNRNVPQNIITIEVLVPLTCSLLPFALRLVYEGLMQAYGGLFPCRALVTLAVSRKCVKHALPVFSGTPYCARGGRLRRYPLSVLELVNSVLLGNPMPFVP